jgi:hypothetical protein
MCTYIWLEEYEQKVDNLVYQHYVGTYVYKDLGSVISVKKIILAYIRIHDVKCVFLQALLD